MTVRSVKLIAIVLVIVGVTTMFLPGNRSMAGNEYGMTSTGLGSVETLMSKYQQWESDSLKKSGDGNLILPLAPSNTFSTEKTEARGEAKINLTDGTVACDSNPIADRAGSICVCGHLLRACQEPVEQVGDSW